MSKSLSRRDFIQRTSGGLLALTAFQALPAEFQGDLDALSVGMAYSEGLSILQGLTTETETELSIDVPQNLQLTYLLVDRKTGQVLEPSWVRPVHRDSSTWRVDKVKFIGLQLGHDYFLNAADVKGHVLDQRILKPLDLQNQNPKFAMISCQLDFHLAKDGMWNGLKKAKPDMVFFLGDNVYGDIAGFIDGPDFLWSRYLETRRRVPFYRWKNLVPVVGIWDDHDFGKNDANGNYQHKKNSLHCFQTFMAQSNVEGVLEAGPGNSYVLDAFGSRFLLLDGRYFRGTESDRKFYGAAQFDWITSLVRRNDKPLWLMQGGQFFGRYLKKGSVEDESPQELHDLGSQLRSGSGPVILASGDIHFAELMEIESSFLGYKTVELTTSSMHSTPPAKNAKNPRRKYTDRRNNFMLVRQDFSGTSWAYKVLDVGRNGAVYFDHQFGF